MTVHKRLIGAAALAATTAFGVDLQAQGPKFHETVTVQAQEPTFRSGGSGRSSSAAGVGDHALTFSAPVALPGVSLAPGTYIFRRPTAGVVQVTNATGEPYRMFITQAVNRQRSTDGYSIVLGPPAAPDSPRRIIALFAPGERTGQQFVYTR
jgi:hypothetical protein